MLIWGKIVGFLSGYLFFGPLGAAIGVIAGQFFDHGLKTSLIPKEKALLIQNQFFKATFLVMGHLAKSDGRISEDEIKAASAIMDELELTEKDKKEAIRLFSQGKDPNFILTTVLIKFYSVAQGRQDILKLFVDIQLTAALADGELTKEERRILLLMAAQFKFAPGVFESLLRKHQAESVFERKTGEHFNQRRDNYSYAASKSKSPLQEAYVVLGIQEEASLHEIKKAYRRLMSQHHPDKLVSRGLPMSMMKLAKEKTQQITAAYNLICKEKQFR